MPRAPASKQRVRVAKAAASMDTVSTSDEASASGDGSQSQSQSQSRGSSAKSRSRRGVGPTTSKSAPTGKSKLLPPTPAPAPAARKRRKEVFRRLTLAEQIDLKRTQLEVELPKLLPDLEQQLAAVAERLARPFSCEQVNEFRDLCEQRARLQQRIQAISNREPLQQFEDFVRHLSLPSSSDGKQHAVSLWADVPPLPVLPPADSLAPTVGCAGGTHGSSGPLTDAVSANASAPTDTAQRVVEYDRWSTDQADEVRAEDLLDEHSDLYDPMAIEAAEYYQSPSRSHTTSATRPMSLPAAVANPPSASHANAVVVAAAAAGGAVANPRDLEGKFIQTARQMLGTTHIYNPLVLRSRAATTSTSTTTVHTTGPTVAAYQTATVTVAMTVDGGVATTTALTSRYGGAGGQVRDVHLWRAANKERMPLRPLNEVADSIMDWSLVAPKIADKDVCADCRLPLVYDEEESMLACEQCGRRIPHWDTSNGAGGLNTGGGAGSAFGAGGGGGGGGGGSSITSSRASCGGGGGGSGHAVKSTHFDAIIARFDPDSYIAIPDAVYDTLRKSCLMAGGGSSSLLSIQTIRELLKRHGFTKYYPNTVQMFAHLNNTPPPIATEQQKAALRIMFNKVREPFERHKGSRVNFISYGLCFIKLCELLGYTEFLAFFDFLKTGRRLRSQEDIWAKICKDLGWPFISSYQ